MNGRILFINHDWYQTDVHYPLNYGYLASSLIQAGAEVEIYDMAVYHQTNEELAHFLDKNTFDIIGVSFMAGRYKETVEEILKVVAKYKKNAWLIVGGHGPSFIPEFILNTTDVDIVAIGEAEETIVDLLNVKLNNENLANIAGIAYKEKDTPIINARRVPPKPLDKLPFPAWHLSPIDYYSTCLKFFNQSPDERSLQILTSRGCVGSCSFCSRLEKGIRIRSIKNIIEEMRVLKEQYKITYFIMADELFLVSVKRLFEFRDALQESDLGPIKFSCDARVDFLTKEIAQCLKNAGCQFVNVGFESADDTVLKLMHKKTTAEENEKAAAVCKKAGLPCGLNILWGLPGDTPDTLVKNVDFIKKYTDYSQLRSPKPVTCYPGSPLYYQAINDGLLLGPGDFFQCFQNLDLISINFTEMDTKEMYRLLYNANLELIMDYHYHRPLDFPLEDANKLIDAFHDLYFLGKVDFRGARHYSAKDK